MTNAEVLKEIMNKYNTYRELWIKDHGNDNGFNEWFTEQVK